MTRAEGEALLRWAEEENPGPWAEHSRVAARAAETIAAACEGKIPLEPEQAYLCGLLHDIGRYEGVTAMRHIVAGYELLVKKGEPKLARVCLTHSFTIFEIGAYIGGNDCAPGEEAVVRNALLQPMDEYDRLLQLCDALALPQGVCLMEKRLMDVALRYGVNEYTQRKWGTYRDLKAHFDALCGGSVYRLFGQEIACVSMR